MKISELAQLTGESIPTIKFYIREGVLAPGVSTGERQASYSEDHIQRLSLVKTLREELSMSVDKIAEIFSHEKGDGREMLNSGLEAARSSKAPGRGVDVEAPHLENSRAELTAAGDKVGWLPGLETPAYADVIAALASIERVMPEAKLSEYLPHYVKIMKLLAECEIPDDFNPQADPVGSLRHAVLGTYLFEPLILALRRYAHVQRACALAQEREAPAIEDE